MCPWPYAKQDYVLSSYRLRFSRIFETWYIYYSPLIWKPQPLPIFSNKFPTLQVRYGVFAPIVFLPNPQKYSIMSKSFPQTIWNRFLLSKNNGTYFGFESDKEDLLSLLNGLNLRTPHRRGLTVTGSGFTTRSYCSGINSSKCLYKPGHLDMALVITAKHLQISNYHVRYPH